MEIPETLKPLFALGCPALAAILILVFGRRPNLREGVTLLASLSQFSIILSMASRVVSGVKIQSYLFPIVPGISFGFRVDAFGLLFALTASSLWILVSIYSIGYMRALKEHAQTRFYFCFALAILGAVGVALSGNLVTMYIFYEILTISTYPLVAHEQSQEAIFAGRKYLAYLLTSGVFLLAAIVFTYATAQTTDFNPGGILSLTSSSRSTLITLFILFILGFMKAAYMPFHSWLPAAMVAPTPVSALLHAVAVVKAGVFGIVRTVAYIYGIDLMRELGLGILLASFAGVTMIVASLFAIAQDNLKRRLAYSTISQLSYIVFGVALLSPMGITGAILHIPFHGFMKITLFLCAGSILVASGKKNISEMGGIGHSMPITMLAFTVGALGMCGLPPACGFVSKWFLGLGTVEADSLLFLAVLLISSLLDVVYFFPIVYIAFFGDRERGTLNLSEGRMMKEAPLSMVIPLSITALFSIIFSFPNPITSMLFDLVRLAISH
ncbi:MAG: monovalent cation/H+ antiporter subunit D family protein [Syntrophaceae bacterium]|nr:monovalent cation/H+ antiporter subunit D family protein [Syntrophaceae bacterium]